MDPDTTWVGLEKQGLVAFVQEMWTGRTVDVLDGVLRRRGNEESLKISLKWKRLSVGVIRLDYFNLI